MVCAIVMGLSLPGMTGAQANAAEIDCDNLETSALAEPAQLRETCNFPKDPNPWVSQDLSRAPTDTGYAQDIGYISDNFVTFTLNDFPNQTVVGTTTNAYYGMDFDAAATTLWALNDTTGELGTIDPATGAFTSVVACPGPGGDMWTGLTIHPATDAFYGSNATDLYTIDPATGVSTLVGAFGQPGGLMIDIAMNSSGEMYAHDIADDAIYSIDPATGVATLVGSTGFDANFAQGMDFDAADGTLYIFLYIGGGANVYGTVDLATGAVTALATDNPQGEFEGAIQVPGGDFEPLVCNGPAVGFDAGIPPDWTVINNVGGNPVEWASIADCGEAGNFTSGAGEGACASSDFQGGGAGLYDTELISPPIDLTGMGIVNISYASNYQNYAGGDFLDLDVSTDGGTTWTTVQSWNEDHPGGGLHSPPGEDVLNLDLSAFGNLSGVLIRWHYYDPVGPDTSQDWYAQIDNVVLNCVIPVELQSFSVE